LNSCSSAARRFSFSGVPCLAATSAISAPVGQELVQGRIEQADRDRQPLMMREQLDEVVALHGQELGERGAPPASSSARIISRTATMRSPSKNMCSVRHRPMPSAPKCAPSASRGVGVGPHLHAARLVGPAHQGRELARQLRAAASSRALAAPGPSSRRW
jgi:hypothetical protein